MRNYPRVFASFMPNAPRLTGTPGALLDVLKKCLTGGWTPFDVTSITVENGIGTIYFNYANCSLPDYCILSITGCNEPLLNTEVTIHSGNVTSGKFKISGIADGTYDGTIKATPVKADWDLLFSGTNQAVIRSANLDSSRTVVQITDTNATTCTFEFATDATAVNTLIDKVKDELNYDKVVLKSSVASGSYFRGWCVVADNSTCYFIVDSSYSNDVNTVTPQINFLGGRPYFFGDYISSIENENRAFGACFPGINVGATQVYTGYGHAGLPFVQDTFQEAPEYHRNVIRSNYIKNRNWLAASYSLGVHSCNPGFRVTGTPSKLSFINVKNLEEGFREVPVYGRVYSFQSAITLYGKLPGIRYSDLFIRNLFYQFTHSELNGTAYFYLPVETGDRTSLAIDSYAGYMPIVINKKWGN